MLIRVRVDGRRPLRDVVGGGLDEVHNERLQRGHSLGRIDAFIAKAVQLGGLSATVDNAWPAHEVWIERVHGHTW